MTNKSRLYSILLLISATSMAGCASNTQLQVSADMLFFGDNIITMEDDDNKIEALAIKDGKIVFSGNRKQARLYQGTNTRVTELGTKVLMPGFIDAHGHFSATARFIDFANLSSPPVGNVNNIDDLIIALRAYVAEQDTPPEWIIGYGYDESLLAEGRHPTRADLDKVSKDIPITVIHVSVHLAVVNSVALKALNINAEMPNPKGGVIRRLANSREPSGVLEESAAYMAFYPLSKISPLQFEHALRKTADYYSSFGITTAQDGASNREDLNFLQSISAKQALPIEISLYQHVKSEQQLADARSETEYINGVKLSGVKFVVDGSPQGRTAWMSKPYLNNGGQYDNDYVAYPTVDEDFYRSAVKTLLDKNVQMISHANGDAAIDLVLQSLQDGLKGRETLDHRSVVIHAQLMRKDQIDTAKSVSAIPSFFSSHPFFWGDWHRLNFGEDRARNISPMEWAKAADLRYTIHNDAPVVPPNMMHLLWASTNRTTRSGHILGENQRASVKDALRAITINAAYQNFEEDSKGSLRVGKQADLVILDRNPLSTDKTVLDQIKVLETIAHGKTVFRAP